MTENNIIYDATFNGNMLVVGQPRCGKNLFVQKLGKNKMLGSIYSVDWMSKIELSEIREHQIFDRLIAMDNVSGLAGKSNEFCSFLTVSRKYRYSCIYIFHIVFPQLRNWQIILCQTKIFNIFPFAVQLGNISKIRTNNCDRETLKYIPKRELWINRLYF